MHEIGWKFPDADGDGVGDDEDCNPTSDRRATIVIGGINTGVPNTLGADGCTRADLVAKAYAASKVHGDFVSHVTALLNGWMKDGEISGAQHGAVTSAAARTK